MIVDTKYMHRCIQLAGKGQGYTSPNPMVGAVVVHNDTIIGEGFHQKCGEAHAEVNAIASVKDKSLLKKSTLYVSLEPCAHYGKTPPCAQLIIDSKISHVVVGALDPFPAVAGKGIKMMEAKGIKVKVGILAKECKELNKTFNMAHTQHRPYIYLKWAQSEDGFMDKIRSAQNPAPTPISNDFTRVMVHKLRSEVDAIMVGTNTVIADNPSLTTRYWHGQHPIRIILDRTLRIPSESAIYNDLAKTIIVTETEHLPTNTKNTEFLNIQFDHSLLQNLCFSLYKRGILSLMVEGGSQLLESIIKARMWDEAFVEVGNMKFEEGTRAPKLSNSVEGMKFWKGSKHFHFRIDSI